MQRLPSNVVDIYDASTGQWSTATLSQARYWPRRDDGGHQGHLRRRITVTSGYSNVVDIYDASTGQWSTATLSQAREYLAATTVGTKAIFAGGYSSSGYSNVVDIYDASTGQWSTATLSQARELPRRDDGGHQGHLCRRLQFQRLQQRG